MMESVRFRLSRCSRRFLPGFFSTVSPHRPDTVALTIKSNMKSVTKSSENSPPNRSPKLTNKFRKALGYASRFHSGKLRKKTRIPDIGHVLGVTAIALEYGASETEAIAALLHDTAEDAGGKKRLRDIRRRFGSAVAKIVDGCTDTYAIPKPPWLQRKKTYVRHVAEASESTQLVSASDKLQNVRSLLRNHREEGDLVWERYSCGKDGALWYYRALANAFNGERIKSLLTELDRAVSELEALANGGSQVTIPPN
jgi:(p)ppGpp synthase/HD superfamily hydrolase